MKLYAISGDAMTFTTKLVAGDDRVQVMQTFEAAVRAKTTNVTDARGTSAVRNFLEGKSDIVQWGGLRLQKVDIPKDYK